jgi:hypothetical protein
MALSPRFVVHIEKKPGSSLGQALSDAPLPNGIAESRLFQT